MRSALGVLVCGKHKSTLHTLSVQHVDMGSTHSRQHGVT